MVAAVSLIRCALIALPLLCACKSKPAAVPPPAPVAQDGAARPERWALSLPMLDGYLRYQRTLLVQAGKAAPPAWDGGLKKYEEPSIEQKADLDERARVEAGLAPDDVVQIEAMLSLVSARRLTSRLMKLDEAMPPEPEPEPEPDAEPEEPRPAMGLETHAEASIALATQAKLKKTVQELTEERATFGSRNIDVLLQREEELLKNWELMMEVPELSKRR